MKLHWFSPLLPAATEVAYYTARVLPALAKRSRVVLWTNQSEWDTRLETHAEVREYDLANPPFAELNRDGVAFYHIGNNPLFHNAIWQMSLLHGGAVVLHDVSLHHFFDGIYRAQWQDAGGYLAEMDFHYGATGRRDAAECFDTNARNIDYMAQQYPLTPLALRHALGVLVHTPEAFKKLREQNRWPVAYAPLPFARDVALMRRNLSTKDRQRAAVSETMPCRLIVFGYLGRNRRVDALLQALAGMPERAHFHLDIYGKLLESERVCAEIASLNLEGQVTVHGFAADEELDEALARADVAINLRNPTMGEASSSQLRLWDHALPSLVTQVGWYATLPEDAVAFVRVNHEIEDIQSHLRELLVNPERFKAMGERGREMLETNHSPEKYAEAVIRLAQLAQDFRTHAAATSLAERAGALMSEWNKALTPDESVQRVATEICALMGASKNAAARDTQTAVGQTQKAS
ncbi:MAG: glycosyltransferase [Pyrinomonadaceae bacterium]